MTQEEICLPPKYCGFFFFRVPLARHTDRIQPNYQYLSGLTAATAVRHYRGPTENSSWPQAMAALLSLVCWLWILLRKMWRFVRGLEFGDESQGEAAGVLGAASGMPSPILPGSGMTTLLPLRARHVFQPGASCLSYTSVLPRGSMRQRLRSLSSRCFSNAPFPHPISSSLVCVFITRHNKPSHEANNGPGGHRLLLASRRSRRVQVELGQGIRPWRIPCTGARDWRPSDAVAASGRTSGAHEPSRAEEIQGANCGEERFNGTW